MAEFATYYDTSGDGSRAASGEVMITVGLLGSERQWRGFEKDWNAMLEKAEIKYLHMRELKRQFRGPGREVAMHVCLSRAVKILRKRAHCAFVVTIGTPDYKAVDAEFELTETVGGAFGLVAGSCAVFADRIFRRDLHETLPLIHHHEEGDSGMERATAYARRYGVTLQPQKAFANGCYFRPFEATDFLAWETRTTFELITKSVDSPTPISDNDIRPYALDLFHHLRTERHLWAFDNLRQKCVEEGVPLRRT